MTQRFVIASVQANPTVGDVSGNSAQAKAAIERAAALGADIALFPELFLLGYPPEDLVLKPAALRACRLALEELAHATATACPALITLPLAGEDGRPRNAVALIAGGSVRGFGSKIDLPNYGVFDEKRVFAPGQAAALFEVSGVKI
ncbi:MAG: nitrilase-related carbon-nitrogen hydrolase, partial [Caulobacteraceae bacterium]